jgi:hypothetical protein
MPEEVLKCCMCQRTDEAYGKIEVLKTGTPAHRYCMEMAALGELADKIGWKKES